MVRRTARACTNGITPITSRPAIRNPMPIYMIDSIMTPPAPLLASIVSRMPWVDHALLGSGEGRHFTCGSRHMPCTGRVVRILGAAPAARTPEATKAERIPGRRRREFEIAHVGAEPHSDARADRNHDDVIHGQRRHSQAADEVSGTVDTGEALIN